MTAKVLKLESGETKQAEEKAAQHRRVSAMAEDRTVRYLLAGKDERGQAIYFLQGPHHTKSLTPLTNETKESSHTLHVESRSL